jgi:hypothetical protein
MDPAPAALPADPSPNSALEALGYDAVINLVVSHLDKEEHKVLRSVSKDLRDAADGHVTRLELQLGERQRDSATISTLPSFARRGGQLKELVVCRPDAQKFSGPICRLTRLAEPL